ncbi:monocyte differentiation antigen CD14 isoform X2 [Parus major]|uniref:monocyte differentiation antigen CD14 isoform X2 n=1 Tax=Parus major TaxID=9157 RepID=UPI0007711AB1|nr:monocyte differentiation antigen CD14 isoform X2 [Parus major]
MLRKSRLGSEGCAREPGSRSLPSPAGDPSRAAAAGTHLERRGLSIGCRTELSARRLWQLRPGFGGCWRKQGTFGCELAVFRSFTMRVAVLLLLGLGLLAAEGRRNRCFFNRTKEHCVCYNLTEETIGSIIQCLPANVVEFQGGDVEKYIAFPIRDLTPSIIETLDSLVIKKIIIGNVLVPEILLARVLRFFSYTHVQELAFESCVFQGTGDWSDMDGQSLPIVSLSFHNVTSAPLTGREPAFSSLSRWLETLQELAVTGSRVTSLPCAIGRLFRALLSLNLAQNSLSDGSLALAFCQGAFPQLQELSLHHNNLSSYSSVCEGVGLLLELRHLDLSHNKLVADPSSSCQWPASLRGFNLSNAGLAEVPTPLPPRLEVLDMSHNQLRAVDTSLSSLKKLFLNQNLLQAVPSIKNYPMLDTLHLDNNSIWELPREEVKLLGSLQDVAVADNPFSCSCSGARGLQALAATGHLGQGWPGDYRCQSPAEYQGWQVAQVPVSVLRCHLGAVVAPLCVILALLGVAGAVCLARTRSCRRA